MHPRLEDDPALTADAHEQLVALLSSGWRAQWSPFCAAWSLHQDTRQWSTSVYRDANKAIQAAASVEARALATMDERVRVKERLRRELTNGV